MLKRKKEEERIKPYTIYLWQEGEGYVGAAMARNKLYYAAWLIETDPQKPDEKPEHKEWHAKTYCKRQLNNTLNAIKLYGKKILDSDGNIIIDRFRQEEQFGAITAHLNKRSLKDERPLVNYKSKTITLQQAQKLKLA